MYIRLVTGVVVIDNDLNFNGFVRIEYERLLGSLHNENIPVLECEACVGDHAGMEKLKKKNNKEGAPYCFLKSLLYCDVTE